MSALAVHQTAPPQRKLLVRVNTWFLLFSGVLFMFLALSWWLLIPRFTWFSVGEAQLSPREMVAYERRLLGELTTMEQTRTRLVLPITHKGYTALKEEKRRTPSVLFLRSQMKAAAARTGYESGIVLESLIIDVPARRVTVTGDVRDVGLSSMTVLAAFVEEAEKLSVVSKLQRPAFVREDAPGIGPHSPFTFSFTFVPFDS